MQIFDLNYLDTLDGPSRIRGGALIPDAPSSLFLDAVFAGLSQEFSDFRNSSSIGGSPVGSRFGSLITRVSGGSLTTNVTVNISSTGGIRVEVVAPNPE